jgi:hypothetical protein
VPNTTKQRLLEYAEERLGRESLAARLKVQEALLAAWIEGRASMPDRKLAPLADVIGGLGDR